MGLEDNGRLVYPALFLLLLFLLIKSSMAFTANSNEPFDSDYWQELSETVYSHDEPAIPEEVNSSELKLPWQLTELLKMVFYIAIAAVLIIILFMILRQKYGDRASKELRKEGLIRDTEDEFTPEPLLREKYQEALQRLDYRYALRYLYLILLRHLAAQNMIILQKGKTNHHYLRELAQTSPQTDIFPLTQTVEAAWFGNRIPDAQVFDHMVSPWNHLIQPKNGKQR